MASPAWLPLEVSPSPAASQSPPSPTGGTPSTSKSSTATANDSMQESFQMKNPNGSSYVAPVPSFFQQPPSSSGIKSGAPVSSVVLQPPIPGSSSSAAPAFSYNISQTGFAFPSGQHLQSSMVILLIQVESDLEKLSHSWFHVTYLNVLAAVAPGSGNVSSASTISQSVSLLAHGPSSSAATTMAPNLVPTTSWVPTGLPFGIAPGTPRTPGTPGPPGMLQPAQISSNRAVASVAADSSSMVQRPGMPTGPVPLNSSIQPQIGASYPSLPALAGHPQGLWLQPPQMGGMPRQPVVPYSAAFPGPLPLMAHGMHLPSVPVPDPQPPGVTPVENSGSIPVSSTASSLQLVGPSGMHTLVHKSGDRTKVNDVGVQDRAAINEQLDAWTAHKTDTGVVYYYNALTGESTYAKPADFKGEPDKVSVQPIPVSIVAVKERYVSSWQIPNEVTELKKKPDGEVSKEHLMSVPNTSVVMEKGSTTISLSTPAINTGGRDAIALRSSGVQPSSSALDLIKKKLQDSGAPVVSSPVPAPSGMTGSESNGSKAVEATTKGQQSENSKDKLKDANGDGNFSDSSSDSEDADSGPTKEECIVQFKEMLKERGVAPFSKWEKELPKIVFDPRFKAIPSYSARRSLFEHYVKTRVEEERKEKRAAQKAAIEGFKQLLDEASEEIDHETDYQTFRKKWGNDPRFMALDRKDRENLLNERVLPLKRAAEEKAQAIRAAAASGFKSMLREKGDITVNSRWSRVKDSLRNDPRYKSVKHEDREVLFNEYLADLRATEEEAEREAKLKRQEQDKLKERERELRKRKEREEQEMERVRVKVRRKEAIASFQALLASWTESKTKLEKDPQGRAANPDLDSLEMEKLFREHIKMLHERCAREFKTLLAEVLTADAAAQETEDGKTVLNSWSTAKRLLKRDPRYNKMPRKDREALWRRHAEEMLRKQKSELERKEDKKIDAKSRSTIESGRFPSGLRGTHEWR
ncbi:hypothetical protein FEM48_Zijuj10G0155600 [Ziziphus jujuba var. spinosa]|uniref:Pre-mRNA-processing protein 40C n=1 Tax=Ziziphus jujuba var. spinosa TaxID=714518 RepID=A0A978UP80_ZIZJJ|nr:hypothetical protein FEM48_Zijuj10G0155600 [Ziziphus jujuba var. spinosa]